MLSPVRRAFQLLLLLPLLLALPARAVTVDAEGQAPIINQDLQAAREAAIRDASELASLQAAAYISTTQEINDGILEIDNLRIRTLGRIHDLKVLDERVEQQTLHVRIRAEIDIDQGCPDGQAATAYRKRLALTLFPLQYPAQASNGQLDAIQSGLPALILQQLDAHPGFEALNATQLNLLANTQSAPSQQLAEGVLSNALGSARRFDAQYLVSGVIRDMSMRTPAGPREPNVFVDLYNRYDKNGEQHLRSFVLDLYIHDGFSGELLQQRHYQLEGLWTRPQEERTGFGSALFWQQPYGQKIRQLGAQIASDLAQRLACEPFAARITQTRGNEVWIDAGSVQGLKAGDRLSVFRRYTHYDDQLRSYAELSNTRLTLTLEQVQPGFSRGRINANTESENIARDDIVIAN